MVMVDTSEIRAAATKINESPIPVRSVRSTRLVLRRSHFVQSAAVRSAVTVTTAMAAVRGTKRRIVRTTMSAMGSGTRAVHWTELR
jgi:hypothetical protein